MLPPIQITIVSDVVCPWCVIGYKNLESAIDELQLQNAVSIVWEPFELNPHISAEGLNLHTHFAAKYGMSHKESLHFREQMTIRGKEVGFDFNYYEEMKTLPTHDAHILLEAVKAEGKQTALKLALFEAFFSNMQDISDRAVLLQASKSVGFTEEKALEALADASLRETVQNRKIFWKQQGVSGVPTMTFNGSSGINGAQPIKVYKQILIEADRHGRVEPLHTLSI